MTDESAFKQSIEKILEQHTQEPTHHVWVLCPHRRAYQAARAALGLALRSRSGESGQGSLVGLSGIQFFTPFSLLQHVFALLWPFVEERLQAAGASYQTQASAWVCPPSSQSLIGDAILLRLMSEAPWERRLNALKLSPSSLRRRIRREWTRLEPSTPGFRTGVTNDSLLGAEELAPFLATSERRLFRVRQFYTQHRLRVLLRLLQDNPAAQETLKASCQAFITLSAALPSSVESEDNLFATFLRRLSNLVAPAPTISTEEAEVLTSEDAERARSETTYMLSASPQGTLRAFSQELQARLRNTSYRPADIAILSPSWDLSSLTQVTTCLEASGLPIDYLQDETGLSSRFRPCFEAMMTAMKWRHLSAWQIRPTVSELATLLTQLGLSGDKQILNGDGWIHSAIFLETYAALLKTSSVEALKDFLQPETVRPYFEQLPDSDKERLDVFLAWLKKPEKKASYQDFYALFQSIFSETLTPENSRVPLYGEWIEAFRGLPKLQLAENSSLKALGEASEDEDGDFTGILVSLLWPHYTMRSDPPAPSLHPGVLLSSPTRAFQQHTPRKLVYVMDAAHSDWQALLETPEGRAWITASQELVFLSAEVDASGARYPQDWTRKWLQEYSPKRSTETVLAHSTAKKRPETLRCDQAPLAQYEQGALAILAPPGSGKTYMVTALALLAIEKGLPADRILMLTYMDSAVQTLRRRLEKALRGDDLSVPLLPVISTIHSLAYQIVVTYRGANQDTITKAFQDFWALDAGARLLILDETQQQAWVENLLHAFQNTSDAQSSEPSALMTNSRVFLRALNRLKTKGMEPVRLRQLLERFPAGFRRLRELLPVYEAYQTRLAQEGALDYTDLLLQARDILQTNAELRASIAERYALIIEDEAQDSSALMQDIVRLLAEEHGNWVRTGDPNQAITGSFSAAEPEQFREFVAMTPKRIELTQSARSAKEIQRLANRYVSSCQANEILASAFYPAVLTPVEGQNPTLVEPIACWRFSSRHEEQRRILEAIQADVRLASSEARPMSIAVLCRYNSAVTEWTRYLSSNGVPVTAQGDFPALDPVFTLFCHTLQLMTMPWSKAYWGTWCEALSETGFILATENDPSEHNADEEENYSDETWPPLAQVPPEARRLFSQLWLYQGHVETVLLHLIQAVFPNSDRAWSMLSNLSPVLSSWAFDYANDLETRHHLESFLERVTKRLMYCLQHKRYPFKVADTFALDFELETTGAPSRGRASGHVLVMTAHRAKGQEFDAVYVPSMTEETFTGEGKWVWLDESDRLEAEIRYLESIQAGEVYDIPRFKTHLKAISQAKLEEEARLVYVAMTRPREKLILSTLFDPAQAGRQRGFTPSALFCRLEGLLQELKDPLSEEEKSSCPGI